MPLTSREPAESPTTHRAATRRSSTLRDAPFTRTGVLAYVLSYVVLSGITIVMGLLLVDHLGVVVDFDVRVANWLGDRRSEAWNDATWVGSGLADTFVKVPAAAVLSAFFVWRWRRWNEAALLVGALALEAAVFVTASVVVDRARPPIPQLDSIPPTSSYPSGHTAAAVAFYGAIVVVTFWHTRRRVVRWIAVMSMAVLVLVVGASRMYRGMHHLSDVAIGVLLGAAALWVVYLVVERPRSTNIGHGPSGADGAPTRPRTRADRWVHVEGSPGRPSAAPVSRTARGSSSGS